MATKADYQKWVWQYKKRRQVHKRQVRELSKKISLWRGRIRRIEKTTGKLKKIERSVDGYFMTKIASKKMDKSHILARNIYYKISIESGIEGKKVSEHIGRYKKTAGQGRLSFTRSFSSVAENKAVFHDFKKYFEITHKD